MVKAPNQASLKLEATIYTRDFKLLVEAMKSCTGAQETNTKDCALEGS